MSHAYDPHLAPAAAAFPAYDLSNLAAVRTGEAAIIASIPPYDPPIPLTIRDMTAPGNIPVRIYAPADQTGPLPCLVYMHGGGFIMGSIDMFHTVTSRWAAEAGIIVVSVGYRLAPEHPFPAGLDDCFTVLRWVEKTADELGVDPARLGVGGESAGGGLAAALALKARDENGPPLCMQYIGIAALDDRLTTPSMQYTDTPMWYRAAAEFSWAAYLGDSEGSPYAAPARATDLTGLPPAFVYVAQFDPLRDEGIDYAQRLAHAEVPTELVMFPGTFHGSALFDAPVSTRMFATLTAALRRGMHG